MGETLKEGKYIYCIIKESAPKTFGVLGIGDRGDQLYTICFDGVSAVVSNAPVKKYAVSRDNTLAHEKAIEEVMKEYTVLPVRFCTIAENENVVRKILEGEKNRLMPLFDRVEEKRELGLMAHFKEEAIYAEVAEKYQDIKRLKSEIEILPPLKTYGQRMEIGKMVETALREENKIYKELILESLISVAEEVKKNNCYGEIMIINAAFLVKREKEAEFDVKVNELDDKYGRFIRFKYTGNLPPFNFVNLIIDISTYAQCPTGKYSCS
ncbi:GvpL/GvpF family gas vesicle protein [Candidatus Saganbacteria bacterium]|nr:GvpL/GvpF family gas vesicle protein [Candidatus Saganbacteria bacterium]